MNTTDFLGLDKYLIGGGTIRQVHYCNEETNYLILDSKPMIPVVQIFDWAFRHRDSYGQPEFKSVQPTLQEMINMSWQELVNGGKGIMYYGLW